MPCAAASDVEGACKAMGLWKRKMTAMALAVVLAAGMCPGFAQAAGLTAAAAAGQEPAALQAQAVKKTVYVLASIKQVDSGKDNTGASYGSTQTVKLSYNKNGLLAKSVWKSTAESRTATRAWKYNKKNQLVKVVNSLGTGKSTCKFTLNGKGKMKRAKLDYGYAAYTWTFKYKSGRVASVKRTGTGSVANDSELTKYTYKNGRIASAKSKVKEAGSSFTHTYQYTYDAKGNLAQDMKAKYNSKGLLAKRYESTGSAKTTVTYKYKAVKVGSKLAAKVKAQQWALINGNFNYALGQNRAYGDLITMNNWL